ncbi:DUF4231 domain-containing protein [Mesorhizobium sp. LjNodule214]|uniref:DUF4231 domain-containing protein n=1 Tax=Mesorhizobium sp. LjNodule214 TaxID=3342252 RepID=UPI003ECC9049
MGADQSVVSQEESLISVAGAEAQEQAPPERIKFLRQKLMDNMEDYDWDARRSMRRAFQIRMIIVILGALTTLLLGLQSNKWAEGLYEPYMSAAALVFSAIIPIFAAWDAFYDHRWQWIQKTVTHRTLAAILYDLEYEASGSSTVPKTTLDALYKRLRSTFDETNRAWQDKRNMPAEK